MPTLEEMTTWSPDEVLQEIQRVLPKGWTLKSGTTKTGFHVSVLLPAVEGEERVLAWEDYHVDQRILLFNAYDWIVTRGGSSVPVKSPISRRQRLAQQAGTRWAEALRKEAVSDPEDVDPDEVNAVYETFRKKT